MTDAPGNANSGGQSQSIDKHFATESQVATPPSPIHHGAVVQIVGFTIAPIVIELVGDLVLVELDA